MVTKNPLVGREVPLPTYVVTIAPGALDRIGDIVRETAAAHRYAIITDDNVGPLYAPRVADALRVPKAATFTMPSGEAHKTRETWAHLTDELLAAGVQRLRLELVRESADETTRLYQAYVELAAGQISAADAVRTAAVHEQFGVTRGTMRTLTVLR